MNRDEKLAIGAANYLNAAPLIEGMRDNPHVVLFHSPPAQLEEKLLSGEIDAGLVPIIDCLAHPELLMAPGLGVCTDGPVRSVLLRCRKPITEITAVGTDPASHTSNALVRILLKHHLQPERNIPMTTDPSAETDANVIIGDRALTSTTPPGCHDYDLAEAWKTMTGLPFVFAVWAYHRNNPNIPEIVKLAKESAAAGEAILPEIAQRFSRLLTLTAESCTSYLTQCVYYRVGEREEKAIRLFEQLLREDGLLPRVTEES